MLGRATAVTVLVLGTAACSEKAIEIELRAAVAPGSESIDLSCMDSVGVNAWGDSIFPSVSCVQFAPDDDRTLARPQLSGKLTMDTPSGGLDDLYVWGMADDCLGGAMFYGGANYARDADGDKLTVFIYPNLSCDQRTAGAKSIHVVDFLELLETQTCATIPDGFGVMTGTIHADPIYGVAYFDQVGQNPTTLVSGTASLSNAFDAATGATCLAAALFDDGIPVATSCVYPGFAGACSPAGELELAVIPSVEYENARDGAISDRFQTFLVGVIWDPALDRAIANATITVRNGDAQIVYTDYATGRFTRRGPMTTGATGTFSFYSDTPVSVDIAAPGYATRTLYLGNDGFNEATGATIITLGH